MLKASQKFSQGKKAGTCKQSGNNAPKFNWKTPQGRVALILILGSAYASGGTDEDMKHQKRPLAEDLFEIFTKIYPQFEALYNTTREEKAWRSGYIKKLKPFGKHTVDNKLLHFFVRSGHSEPPIEREYGLAPCHPDSLTKQGLSLREVRDRCGKILESRIKRRRPITDKEVERWGAL